MPEHLRLPYFYLLPKIHKIPWKTRPVVSGVSTVNEPLSKWIDIQLQQVIHLCPAYLKDSWQLQRELRELQPLPPDAICFMADAVWMYTNIDNQHGIETIGRWLNLHRANLPTDFPSLKIIQINWDGTLMTSTFQKPMNLYQVYSMDLSTAPYIDCSGKIWSKTRSKHSPSSFSNGFKLEVFYQQASPAIS
jgi:hypothetical protein